MARLKNTAQTEERLEVNSGDLANFTLELQKHIQNGYELDSTNLPTNYGWFFRATLIKVNKPV